MLARVRFSVFHLRFRKFTAKSSGDKSSVILNNCNVWRNNTMTADGVIPGMQFSKNEMPETTVSILTGLLM